MSKCTKCNKEKEQHHFSFRNDTQKYRTICRKCSKGYKTNRKDKKENIIKNINKCLKECGKCKELKTLDNFHKDKQTFTGYTSLCIECKKEYSKNNKSAIKKSTAKKRYNIDSEKYDYLMSIDNCQICNSKLTNNNRCIDHCHNTLDVRGVLCSFCNIGLGHFKDSLDNLNNAIKYLTN